MPTSSSPIANNPVIGHTYPVLLFDGVCNLCNRGVQFVLRHDRKKIFRFASLQGDTGQQILRQFGLPAQRFSSFILLEQNKVYTRSTAALRVMKKMNGGWPLLYALIIVPPFIRNAVYDLIARNRYKWFGKKETCWVPTAELKSRFLE